MVLPQTGKVNHFDFKPLSGTHDYPYVDCVGKTDFQSIYEGVVDYYMGEYSSDEYFVQYLYEDDTFNIPNWVVIDWESTASNIMYDYFESNGHYFRS